MTLTNEEHQAIAGIGNVRITVDGIDCFLVRADIFERVRNILSAESSEDPHSTYPAILRAWDQDGSPDDYEDYRDQV